MRQFFFSLRFRLLLLVLLAILPALGLTIYTAAQQRRLLAANIREDALRLARLAANNQEQLSEGAHQVLITLAQLPAVQQGDAPACNELFADLLAQYPFYTGFTAAGRQGDIFCSAPPLSRAVNFSDRTWYQHLIETEQFVVGEYQIGRLSGKAVVVAALPVFDDQGQIQAVVTTGLNLAWLNRLATQAQLPPDSVLTVFDRNGTILAHHPDSALWTGRSMPHAILTQVAATPGEGIIQAPGLDNVTRIHGFKPLSSGAYLSVGIPTAVAFVEMDRVVAQGLIGLGLVAALALAAAWFGGDFFILRDIDILVRATRQLAGGDLGARTGRIHGHGELNQLAVAFDQMAETLQKQQAQREKAQAELKALNETLEQRVLARTEELARSNAELEQFAYVASHDLQEPLRAVSGYLQFLERRYQDKLDAEARRFITRAVAGASRMKTLINDLLAYSRVGRRDNSFSPTDCTVVLERTLTNLETAIADTGARITHDPLPTLMADGSQLAQLFQNLLGNAIKFRDDTRPEIHVGAQQRNGEWLFSIRDNGLGLDAQYSERTFQIFQRLHTRSEYSGTGIGLAICKKIVEGHGGRIWVTSEPDQGSTFFFTMPDREVNHHEEQTTP